ncbi:Acyl-CoA dehydrogenase FadE34 [Methylobacterium crusticola]|uniref:Acyl-CoA dehydrogenase FadE34 n=1 Tax=Methylobacterium crusticola TaxID=1697972 RepID=A0ABQ4QSR4_9HYPH|nr:acyl-CoA dehydrogenase family protein [Methylobacterium crusticola]GJD48357.1 Acyl-CoA dehydrogenase FadE34 [Methylobacterium crusticola]
MLHKTIRLDPIEKRPEFDALRREVRAFLAEAGRERDLGRTNWSSFDPGFSRLCGQRGYVGMTWPARYGGRDASPIEKYVVNEELIAGGAPLGAHWVADRQSGTQILRHAREELRADILPRIARGECYFGIGMSEPGSGSDLASVQMRARRADGGWLLSGRKLWTTNAHRVHYLIALARTSPAPGTDRRAGLTQFIVDMATPGLGVRPVHDLVGHHEFNELTFDDVRVPDSHVLGREGDGWALVTGELAFERSGPDRYLSNAQLLLGAADRLGAEAAPGDLAGMGRLVAHLAALRRMSGSVAGMLERGLVPNAEAALVKDVGTRFEQEVPETVRKMTAAARRRGERDERFDALTREMILTAPCYTIRGGTTEILRGIIARDLGLR